MIPVILFKSELINSDTLFNLIVVHYFLKQLVDYIFALNALSAIAQWENDGHIEQGTEQRHLWNRWRK